MDRQARSSFARATGGGLSPHKISSLTAHRSSLTAHCSLLTAHFVYGHCALVNRAPSIQMVCPLMNEAPWLARKTTVGAMSAARPTRPRGVSLDHVPA